MCVFRVCELNWVSTYLQEGQALRTKLLAQPGSRSVRKFCCGHPYGQETHILLIPELMQLLMGMSMSWMVDPAEAVGGVRHVYQVLGFGWFADDWQRGLTKLHCRHSPEPCQGVVRWSSC